MRESSRRMMATAATATTAAASHPIRSDDQLLVTDQGGPFPFLWIAASGRGTIVKIDTRTGAILGEYSTNPDNRTYHNPSRTTAALDGSVWAGNRGDRSVILVGLVEEGQCVDRNGNGIVEGLNNKVKVSARRTYGYRRFRTSERRKSPFIM